MKRGICIDCNQEKSLTTHHLLDRDRAFERAIEQLSKYEENGTMPLREDGMEWNLIKEQAKFLRHQAGTMRICRGCHDIRHGIYPERTRLNWTEWKNGRFIVKPSLKELYTMSTV